MPGLIDAHSHLGIYEEKKGQIGDNSNETTEPITPCLKAIDAVNPMDSGFHNAIKTGITSVMVGPQLQRCRRAIRYKDQRPVHRR